MVAIDESIPVQNCNHEKADTRIVVHVLHALEQGSRLSMCALSTHNIVLAGIFHDLVATQHLADIRVTFGISKNDRF